VPLGRNFRGTGGW